jgi:threonine dehydrogenase-like Zn-dependent dehydrogenase
MEATINLRPYRVFRRDWTIIGSFALCYTFQPAIDWLTGGVVNVEPLVSHTLLLSEFPQAFGQFAAGKTLKVVVVRNILHTFGVQNLFWRQPESGINSGLLCATSC